MSEILEVRDLESGYGKFQILFQVSLKVKRGGITVIIGPNGSGKSTLLRSVFGLCTVYSGRILLGGEDITGMKPHEIARMGVAYLPQLGNVFENLTVMENLKMSLFFSPKRDESKIDDVLEFFPVLKGYLDRKAATLSGGERQMLAMAMALIRNPKLMMLDEPSASLSPKITEEVFSKIGELRDEFGITILLVEQNVKKALEIGEYVYLLVAGKNAFEGRPDELKNHPELASMYLGLTLGRGSG